MYKYTHGGFFHYLEKCSGWLCDMVKILVLLYRKSLVLKSSTVMVHKYERKIVLRN